MNERLRSFFRALGPAIIVACVVLGPGSILTSSRVGTEFGYQMVWALIGAGLLMAGTMVTAAHVGATLTQTPGRELKNRLGHQVAQLMGISVFLIAAGFQFSNNLGVLSAIEPLVGEGETARKTSGAIIVALNAFLIACLFGFRELYVPIERLMMVFVACMLLGFSVNLVLAHPSLTNMIGGLIPSLPDTLQSGFWPRLETVDNADPVLIDPWLSIQGLTATTFSIAGAFYQAYLVKEKRLEASQVRQRVVDALAGVSVLVGISLMIMVTSASVLAGRVAPEELRSIADVAKQLEPLFGSSAQLLFCVGLFAAALSSFLVNSMIGGSMLADGLNLDARLDSTWTRSFTVLVLLIGMVVALATDPGSGHVRAIIFAQAMTVLGGPVLAFSLLYLARCASRETGQHPPMWALGLTYVGAGVVLLLAARTCLSLVLRV